MYTCKWKDARTKRREDDSTLGVPGEHQEPPATSLIYHLGRSKPSVKPAVNMAFARFRHVSERDAVGWTPLCGLSLVEGVFVFRWQHQALIRRLVLKLERNPSRLRSRSTRPTTHIASIVWFATGPARATRDLGYAAVRGDASLVKCLVECKADSSDKIRKDKPELLFAKNMSVLSLAAHFGNNDVLEVLLSCRANVHACDSHGLTALHWAAASENVRAIQILSAAGSDHEKAGLLLRNLNYNLPLFRNHTIC